MKRPGIRLARLAYGGNVAESELDKVFAILDEIDTAMLTTRRADGHLVSRAMATQSRAPGADLWFVTMEASGKLQNIAADPHVNLTYFNESSREWISVPGTAAVSRDRARIAQLYKPDWAIWFPQGDDPRYGTPDDPRMVLIGIRIAAATFLEINQPKPVVLYEMVKGWVTGAQPDVGETHRVER
jgi:general stress protein 26